MEGTGFHPSTKWRKPTHGGQKLLHFCAYNFFIISFVAGTTH